MESGDGARWRAQVSLSSFASLKSLASSAVWSHLHHIIKTRPHTHAPTRERVRTCALSHARVRRARARASVGFFRNPPGFEVNPARL